MQCLTGGLTPSQYSSSPCSSASSPSPPSCWFSGPPVEGEGYHTCSLPILVLLTVWVLLLRLSLLLRLPLLLTTDCSHTAHMAPAVGETKPV